MGRSRRELNKMHLEHLTAAYRYHAGLVPVEILEEAQQLTAREAWARFNGASKSDRDRARAVFDAVLRRVGKVSA